MRVCSCPPEIAGCTLYISDPVHDTLVHLNTRQWANQSTLASESILMMDFLNYAKPATRTSTHNQGLQHFAEPSSFR